MLPLEHGSIAVCRYDIFELKADGGPAASVFKKKAVKQMSTKRGNAGELRTIVHDHRKLVWCIFLVFAFTYPVRVVRPIEAAPQVEFGVAHHEGRSFIVRTVRFQRVDLFPMRDLNTRRPQLRGILPA